MSEPATKPGQAQALDIIWRQSFGMTAPAPAVEWVETFNCGTGTDHPGWLSGETCTAGGADYEPTGSRVASAWWPWREGGRFSRGSELAHEACHIKEAIEGTAVGDHQGPCFTGPQYANAANAALAAVGL